MELLNICVHPLLDSRKGSMHVHNSSKELVGIMTSWKIVMKFIHCSVPASSNLGLILLV